jgi:succinate dehydrogenase/fumarate reductase flavoprotein subunit
MADYDVVVLGAGIAGMCAAIAASEEDRSVLLVDAEDSVGGRSQFSTGMIMAAGTRFQHEKGIEDNAESLFRHYMTLNQWKVDAGVVKALCYETGPAVEWLADMGLEVKDVYFSGDENVPRGHVTPGGDAIVKVLHNRVRKAGIDVALRRRADQLVVEGGRVTGVRVGDDSISASVVVLATGGIEGNAQLIEKYIPMAVELAGARGVYPNGGAEVAKYSRGDAIPLSQQVGAQITGFNRFLSNITPGFSTESDTYFPAWLVVVNSEGRRFYDEMSPYSVTQPIVYDQGGPVDAIFDDEAKRAAQPRTTEKQRKVRIPGQTWEDWIEPIIDENVETGKVVKRDTIAGLAQALAIPPDNLIKTLDKYNADVAAGEDTQFLKKPDYMRPVTTGPFYAAEVRLSRLSVTAVGPKVDRDGRVLDEGNSPILGLFAAGECTGGVLGDVYVGSGNALANCIAFGRIAGRSAARSVQSSPVPVMAA